MNAESSWAAEFRALLKASLRKEVCQLLSPEIIQIDVGITPTIDSSASPCLLGFIF